MILDFSGRKAVFCLSLIGTVVFSGCTAPTREQINRWGLKDFVQVYEPVNQKEALLAHAFTQRGSGDFEHRVQSTMDNFSTQEEEIAQKALTNDKANLSTEWTNKRYGDIKFLPGESFRDSARQCRKFSASWIFTGTYRTQETEKGSACLNPVTKRWEWND